MRNHQRRALNLGLIAVIGLGLFSNTAWALNTACSSSSWNLGAYNAGSNPGGLPGNADGINGCEQVDKIFSAFSYTPNGTAPVAGSNVPVTFLGSTPLGGIAARFGDPAALNPTWNVTGVGATTGAVAPYDVSVDPASSLAGGTFYAITSLALNVNYTLAVPSSSSDTLTLHEYFCGGGATACAGGGNATGGINLAAPTAGYVQFTVIGSTSGSTSTESFCYNSGSSSCTPTPGGVVNFGTFFTDVYVASNLSLNSNGNQVGLNFFTESFFQTLETPEPATFGMMGAALAGLGLLGLCRRK